MCSPLFCCTRSATLRGVPCGSHPLRYAPRVPCGAPSGQGAPPLRPLAECPPSALLPPWRYRYRRRRSVSAGCGGRGWLAGQGAAPPAWVAACRCSAVRAPLRARLSAVLLPPPQGVVPRAFSRGYSSAVGVVFPLAARAPPAPPAGGMRAVCLAVVRHRARCCCCLAVGLAVRGVAVGVSRALPPCPPKGGEMRAAVPAPPPRPECREPYQNQNVRHLRTPCKHQTNAYIRQAQTAAARGRGGAPPWPNPVLSSVIGSFRAPLVPSPAFRSSRCALLPPLSKYPLIGHLFGSLVPIFLGFFGFFGFFWVFCFCFSAPPTIPAPRNPLKPNAFGDTYSAMGAAKPMADKDNTK